MLTVKEINFSQEGAVGETKLSATVFGVDYNEALVHQIVTATLANARVVTKRNKNRSAVAGGGAKPHPQKNTGRARAGTTRGPLWRKGGKTFTGVPVYTQKVNRKMHRGAMRAIYSEFARQGLITVVDSMNPADHRTRTFLSMVAPHGLENATFILDQITPELYLSCRNIHTVWLADALTIDPYTLFRAKHLVISKAAVQQIEELLA